MRLTLASGGRLLHGAKARAGDRLRRGGRGTLVDFTGDFSIKVPFLGGKLEAQAAPALLESFAVQQKVGDEWLAR